MGDGPAIKKDGDVNGGGFPADRIKIGKAAHDVEHLVLIKNDDFL